MRSNDVTEIFQFLKGKRTLVFFEEELVMLKQGEYLSQVVDMVIDGLTINKDIVHKHKY